MVLIVFLVGALVYFLPRIRRDKNGKPYIYSRSYEYQKNRLKEQGRIAQEHSQMIQDLCETIDESNKQRDICLGRIEKRVKSIELEDLKQSFYLTLLPPDERLISGLKYVYAGGNGLVREDVARFVEENPIAYKSAISKFPQWALAQDEEQA
jgi:hypothetical protein